MKKKNDTSYKKYLLFLAIFLLLFIIFKGVLIIAILIILSLGMSYIVNNYNLRQYGFELVTFVGVLTGMKYGPLYGLIVSFILITYHMVFGGFIAQYVFWVIPSYSLAGLIAGFFPNSSVSNLGFYLALFTNIIN